MSFAIWPATLPRPDRDGWQSQLADPRLKRSVDAGPPGYRRRWSSVPRRVALKVTLKRDQKAVFEKFIEDDLQFGSKPFEMPDPTTEGWPMLTDTGEPVLDGDGRPILLAAKWICLLGDDMPQETVSGIEFVMSFSVWVMP